VKSRKSAQTLKAPALNGGVFPTVFLGFKTFALIVFLKNGYFTIPNFSARFANLLSDISYFHFII